MRKFLTLLIVCFGFVMQGFAAKDQVKYVYNEIDKNTGDLHLQAKQCDFKGFHSSPSLLLIYERGNAYLLLHFRHRYKGHSSNTSEDFTLDLNFADGSKFKLLNDGFSVVPYTNMGEFSYYGYRVYFNLDNDLLEKMSLELLTSMKTNDFFVVGPDVEVGEKSNLKNAESLRMTAADFLSKIRDLKRAEGVEYVESRVDEFTNKKVFETKKLPISKYQNMSLCANDTNFYLNFDFQEVGSLLTNLKARFVYDDLSYNEVTLSKFKDKKKEDGNLWPSVGQRYNITCQSESKKSLLEGLAKRKLSYIRFISEGNHTYSAKITSRSADRIHLYANDLMNKMGISSAKNAEVKGNSTNSKLEGTYLRFEYDENDTTKWEVWSAPAYMNNRLEMYLGYITDKYSDKNSYYLNFKVIKDADFSLSHNKDIFLKLENGEVINLKTNNFGTALGLAPLYQSGKYKYYAKNYALLNVDTLKKLAASRITKVRVVTTSSNIDADYEGEVKETAALQIQLQAKEMLENVK